MEQLRKQFIKSLARTVSMITGSTKPYRRIMRTFGKNTQKSKFPKSVNCHGFTFYILGIDNAEYPRYIPPEIMEEFLYENGFRSREENGVIAVLRGGQEELAHSSVYIPTSQGPLLIQKEEIGRDYNIQLYNQLLEEDLSLKNETYPEYYKIFPDKIKIPAYFQLTTLKNRAFYE